MKAKLLVLALVVFSVAALAQPPTTFIFVRHAEKASDGSKDPDLNEEGKQRAIRLSQMLSSQKMDAVFSTNYKRTRHTVEQVAKEHGVTVTTYESLDAEQLKTLASKYKGGTVLICGHSNTAPVMINALLGTQTFRQWDDADHGNVVVVSVASSGEASATTLRY